MAENSFYKTGVLYGGGLADLAPVSALAAAPSTESDAISQPDVQRMAIDQSSNELAISW